MCGGATGEHGMGSPAQRALRCIFAAAAFGMLACPARADDVIANAVPPKDELQVAVPTEEAAPDTQIKVLRTRFVVGLEHKVDYRGLLDSHPNRVVIELPNIKFSFRLSTNKLLSDWSRRSAPGLLLPERPASSSASRSQSSSKARRSIRTGMASIAWRSLFAPQQSCLATPE